MEKKVRDPANALSVNPKTAESKFLKFSWLIVVALAVLLGLLGYFLLQRRSERQPAREPVGRSEVRGIASLKFQPNA